MGTKADSFCPKCGSGLKTRRIDKKSRQICPNCGFILYKNSAPCASVFILDKDNKLLLVKRAVKPFKGSWDIPGGFLEAGEDPEKGAIREIKEETGLVIQPLEIFGIFMDVYGPEKIPTMNICYLAKVLGGRAKVGSDAIKMNWFEQDKLPKKIAFKWSRKAIKLLKKSILQ